jgi:sigma-B regulation protein RsbU (phosphoserine phosphatase)
VRYAIERQHLERRLKRAVEDLDREFRTVAELQAGFLPAGPPDLAGFDVATHYRPAERAGGDYFDFLALPNGCCGVLIADVSGHGAPAAVVMAMVRLLVHTSGRLTPPQEVLAELNKALAPNIPSREFVTACYGVVDPGARRFEYALAGHAPPIVFGPQGVHPAPGEDAGPALGLLPRAAYACHVLDVAAGGGFVLYTDGISESRNLQDEEFGEDGIARAVAAAGTSQPSAIGDQLLAALREHRGADTFDDDVTFIILAARPSAPWADRRVRIRRRRGRISVGSNALRRRRVCHTISPARCT